MSSKVAVRLRVTLATCVSDSDFFLDKVGGLELALLPVGKLCRRSRLAVGFDAIGPSDKLRARPLVCGGGPVSVDEDDISNDSRVFKDDGNDDESDIVTICGFL